MSEWQPIETAPKGNPTQYGVGPSILGLSVGVGWKAYNIVHWCWHKNAKTGSWKGPNGGWEPDYWMSLDDLPAPPEAQP